MESDGGGHELLLGDKHFEVAVGVVVSEFCSAGGVADFAVQRHDSGVSCAQGDQRGAVGSSGGDLVAQRVARLTLRTGSPGCRSWCGALARRRFGTGDGQLCDVAKLSQGPFGHLGWKRLAVPAFLIFDLTESASLDGFRQDYRGRRCLTRRGECAVDVLQVVPVDGDRPGAEGFNASRVGRQVPAQFGWSALPEPVHVDNDGEVRQPVVTGLV